MRNKNIRGHYTNANIENYKGDFKPMEGDDELFRWVIMFGDSPVGQERIFSNNPVVDADDLEWMNKILDLSYIRWVRRGGMSMELQITSKGTQRMQDIKDAHGKENEVEARRRRVATMVNNLRKGGS